MVLLALAQAAVGALTIVMCGRSIGGWPGRLVLVSGWGIVLAMTCQINQNFPLQEIYAKQEPGKLLALVEGSGAAITVHQRTEVRPGDLDQRGELAGTNPVFRATQKLQAHLPICLHPAPRSVLQIGFGSGGTCYSVSLHPEVESIEVVELNPDVLRVASDWFGDINHGVLKDPRVRTRIADAKSHVASSDQTYDLILSDSTHPRFRGNAALYARDYFADCSRRLRPGGLLSTWLPLYGQSVEDIRGILKSIQSVFPHVQVWYANSEPHENTIVLASQQPITIDPDRLGRRLAAAPVARDLAEVEITSTIQVLDFFLLGDRAVADFSRTGRLNTDDHPRLEFLAPRSLRRLQSWAEDFAALSAGAGADRRLSRRRRLRMAGAAGPLVRGDQLQACRPVSRARAPRRRGPGGVLRGCPPQSRRHPRANPARPVPSRTGPSMTKRPSHRESLDRMAGGRKGSRRSGLGRL